MIQHKTELLLMSKAHVANLLPMLQWELHPGSYLEAWLSKGELKVRIYSSQLDKASMRIVRSEAFDSDIQVIAGTLIDHRFRTSAQIGPRYRQLAVQPDGRLEIRDPVNLVPGQTEVRVRNDSFHVPAGTRHWLESYFAVVLMAVGDEKTGVSTVCWLHDVPFQIGPLSPSPLLWQPILEQARNALLETLS